MTETKDQLKETKDQLRREFETTDQELTRLLNQRAAYKDNFDSYSTDTAILYHDVLEILYENLEPTREPDAECQRIDTEVLGLLEKRVSELAPAIANIKKRLNQPTYDAEKEKEKIAARIKQIEDERLEYLNSDKITRIFNLIFKASKKEQDKIRGF